MIISDLFLFQVNQAGVPDRCLKVLGHGFADIQMLPSLPEVQKYIVNNVFGLLAGQDILMGNQFEGRIMQIAQLFKDGSAPLPEMFYFIRMDRFHNAATRPWNVDKIIIFGLLDAWYYFDVHVSIATFLARMEHNKNSRFAIWAYHNVGEIHEQIDRLLDQPIRPVRRDEMEKYLIANSGPSTGLFHEYELKIAEFICQHVPGEPHDKRRTKSPLIGCL